MSLEANKLFMALSTSLTSSAQIFNSIIDNWVYLTSNEQIRFSPAGGIKFKHPLFMNNKSITGCNLIHSSGAVDLDFETLTTGNVKCLIGPDELMNVTNGAITMTVLPNLAITGTVPANVSTNFINWNNFTTPIAFNPVFKTSAAELDLDTQYAYRGGYYLRVGNMIFFNLYLKINTLAPFTVTNAPILVSLPVPYTFSSSSIIQTYQIGTYSGLVTASILSIQTFTGTGTNNVLSFHRRTGTSSTNFASVVISDISSSFAVTVGGVYYLY